MGTYDVRFIPRCQSSEGNLVVIRVRANSYPEASRIARGHLRAYFRDGEPRRWMLAGVGQVIR